MSKKEGNDLKNLKFSQEPIHNLKYSDFDINTEDGTNWDKLDFDPISAFRAIQYIKSVQLTDAQLYGIVQKSNEKA